MRKENNVTDSKVSKSAVPKILPLKKIALIDLPFQTAYANHIAGSE